MKAMIGNICLVDGVETALDITHLMVLSGYSNPWCKIEPIHLTEELLLRLGFEHDEDYDELWTLKSFWIDKTDGGFIYDNHNLIQHVHQLQNIYFALTGEELKLIDG